VGRSVLFAALAISALMALPAAADATTRFAAPGGTAADTVCVTPSAAPCSLNEAAGGPDVVHADEVVVTPGDYSDTAGDLGEFGFVAPKAGNIHGASGQPRPVITLDSGSGFGAIDVTTGVTVSYLAVQSTVSDRAIAVTGGVLDGVIARGTGSFGAACEHLSGIIRNSACISTAVGGTAVGVSVGTSGAETPTLRNVTAIATGSGSFAASYRVVGTGTISLTAKGVIARGVAGDVRASGSGGGSTAITIDHSNFATTDTSLGGGTITDGGNNQTTAPLLAADNVHQLSGSPTIDSGAVDGSSGSTDVDGQPRTIGSAPDIGADELGHSTSTAVACVPSIVPVSASSTCTATVTDTAGSPTTPSGNVGFTTDGAGTFGGGGSCSLSTVNASQASCQLTYTPTAVGTGTHQITAAALGDSSHDPSQGSTTIEVDRHATSTAVSCLPTSLIVGSGSSTCTATVTDTEGAPTTPTGNVGFTTDGTGTFGNGGDCSLSSVNTSQASCQLTYTPTTVGTGTHQITGSYAGDSTHSLSQGSTPLTVAPLRATKTSISCLPDSLTLGAGSSTCVVTVTELAALGSITPTGDVSLSSTNAGAFSSGCGALSPVSSTKANCTVTYTPTGVGTHQLTGSYAGDAKHKSSRGSTFLTVMAQPSTGPGATPPPFATKKKCKKKQKRSAAAAKKKCKKKKLR
jgi:hypothetical protein